MAMDRVQFPVGLPMVDFFKQYGTEANRRRVLERAR